MLSIAAPRGRHPPPTPQPLHRREQQLHLLKSKTFSGQATGQSRSETQAEAHLVFSTWSDFRLELAMEVLRLCRPETVPCTHTTTAEGWESESKTPLHVEI